MERNLTIFSVPLGTFITRGLHGPRGPLRPLIPWIPKTPCTLLNLHLVPRLTQCSVSYGPGAF